MLIELDECVWREETAAIGLKRILLAFLERRVSAVPTARMHRSMNYSFDLERALALGLYALSLLV